LLTRMEQSAAVILNDLTLRDWVSDAPLPSSHENE
jgi:hypothetical protein